VSATTDEGGFLVMSNIKHGKRWGSEYRTWANMKQRCNNPNKKDYKYYGGRGVKVCEHWNSFENFYNDMGERPKGMTLDRIDNNKGYFKDNCRWVDKVTQSKNQNIRKDNKSGCKGVHFDPIKKLWRANISINGKQKYIGRFKKLEDAVKARKDAELKYW
jgi:hypothetical protein